MDHNSQEITPLDQYEMEYNSSLSLRTTDDVSLNKFLISEYNTYLQPIGVSLPIKGKLRRSLNFLVKHMGEFVHIDDIKEYVEKEFTLTGTDPVQVRHLSTQKGFYIDKQGRFKHRLVTLRHRSPDYIPDRRNNNLTDESWEKIKEEYGFMCVNCGAKEGDPMRWTPTEITVLQRGHMDPRKDLTEDNCIPQCRFCNQRCKDKCVFDKRGQTILLL